MGGAASFMNQPGCIPTTVFLSTEVIEGCRLLGCDELLRKSFVEYVKSGAWLELIAHYVPEDLSAITDTFSYVEGKMTLEGLSSPSNPSEKSSLGGSSKKSIDNPESSKSVKSSQLLSLDEAYTGWTESFPSFSSSQLSCLLFAVVFPHYVKSSTHRRHVKYGARAAHHAEEESSVCSHSVAAGGPGMVQTPHSSRAQEMLLACAAYFDETPMLEMVREDWAESVSTFLSTHNFGISVVDTSKVGSPFVYVNRRFESLFGYKSEDILGKSVQILNGEKTEPSKKARLLIAFKSQLCTKLYITRYASSGRAVQDAVAVQRVGAHAICIHFSNAEKDPAQAVDDLVALIACLMRKPADTPPSPAPSPLYRQSSWFGPLQMSPPSPLLTKQTSWFGPRALPALNLSTTLPFLLRAVHSPVGYRSPVSGTGRLAHGGEGSGGGVDRASSRSNCSGGSRGRGSVRSHGSHRSAGSGGGSGGGSGCGVGAGGAHAGGGGGVPARVHSFHSIVSGGGSEGAQRAKGAFLDT